MIVIEVFIRSKMNSNLLLEYFPELHRPHLKKTTAKQWDKFLNGFAEICLWVHCGRSRHHNGKGIVLFPKWWDKHWKNYGRWHFNVYDELRPFIQTDRKYNYKKGICKEWIVSEEFKARSASFVRDYRFKTDPKWSWVIHSILYHSTSEIEITRSCIVNPNINLDFPPIEDVESEMIIHSLAHFIKEGLSITYSEAPSGRLHHPIQNIKKIDRPYLFGNWFNCDFKSCAPTVLSQIFKKLCPNEKLNFIDYYLANTKDVRDTIHEQTGIDPKLIKGALTGMFFGMTIPSESQVKWDVNNSDWGTDEFDKFIFSIVNSLGPHTLQQLLGNDLFAGIDSDCKKIVKAISAYYQTLVKRVDGEIRLGNSVGKIKVMKKWSAKKAMAHIYFGIERQLIDIVSRELEKQNINFFLIHDGWICDKQFCVEELIQKVKVETEFDLLIEIDQIAKPVIVEANSDTKIKKALDTITKHKINIIKKTQPNNTKSLSVFNSLQRAFAMF